jgi:type I restriction enzyme S subunit
MAQQEVIKMPSGWDEALLENIASDVSYGYTASSTNEKIGPHLLRITDIQNNKVDWNSVPYCQIDDVKLPQYIVKQNDLLFARTGATVGKSYLVNEDVPNSVYASYLIRVRCLDGADIRYMAHFFNSPIYWNQITEFSSGIGQPNVNGTKLKALNIPLAPLAEQKRIVEKLDSLLAQVETIQQRLNTLPNIIKRFRQSVLAAAVSGKLTTSNEEQQKAEVGEPWSHEVTAPKHWELSTFKDVVTITGGSQPPKSEFIADNGEGLVRLIQIRDYKSDKFIVYVPKEKVRRFCSASDIMIGRYGPPIFQILRGLEGAYNVALMKADPASEKLDKEFLFRFLQSPTLFNYIDAGSDRTAGQTGVNKKFLENYPIFVPPVEEQTEIVRLVEQHFALADTLEKNLKSAKQRVDNLTQSILAKAFKGELVPQDPNDEPAEQLLARIKTARAEAELLEKAAKKVGKASKSKNK